MLIAVKRKIGNIQDAIRHKKNAWMRHAKRSVHGLTSPPVDQRDEHIVKGLRTEGTLISSLNDLRIPGSKEMFSDAQSLLRQLSVTGASEKGSSTIHVEATQIERCPSIIKWGLSERLLRIVERHIGLPIAYRGVSVRRDLADGSQYDTRLWHKDYEDYRIVKIIVYLSDVFDGGGPYEYIPKKFLPLLADVTVTDGRVHDEKMDVIVPRDSRVPCFGKAGSVVFTDSASVYHRGQVPDKHDRHTLFFCYNSASPQSPHFCQPFFDRNLMLNDPGLSIFQKKTLSYNY